MDLITSHAGIKKSSVCIENKDMSIIQSTPWLPSPCVTRSSALMVLGVDPVLPEYSGFNMKRFKGNIYTTLFLSEAPGSKILKGGACITILPADYEYVELIHLYVIFGPYTSPLRHITIVCT